MIRIPAIDVHGHYGNCLRGSSGLVERWMSADAGAVAARAKSVGIRWTAVSPLAGLFPRNEADAVSANEDAAADVSATEGLLQWVIVHPLQPQTFQQAAEFLKRPHCVGNKIQPEEHGYPIREFGTQLFEFAAQHDAVVLAHSGDPLSLPADFVGPADAFPNVKLILAHLGNGGGAAGDPTLQVAAVQKSRQGNLFVDTSSARSIVPGLVEWTVREIGADRILFGSDTPLYSVAMQRARIDAAEIDNLDKRRILWQNACDLFGIQENEPC